MNNLQTILLLLLLIISTIFVVAVFYHLKQKVMNRILELTEDYEQRLKIHEDEILKQKNNTLYDKGAYGDEKHRA